MSFVFKYHRLLKVLIRESGNGSVLRDFSFAPSQFSRKLLEDHRLLFRGQEGGFVVYYQTNPLNTDPVMGRITSRRRFSFCLLGAPPGFFTRYKPDLTSDTGPQLYLDNLTDTGSIQAASKVTLSVGDVVETDDAMKICPAVFGIRLKPTGGPAPTKFRIRDKFKPADVLLEVPIVSGGAQSVTKINLSGRSAGPYTLETDAADSKPRTVYLDNDLAVAPILGLVDIYWETPQNAVPAGGLEYAIHFQKR